MAEQPPVPVLDEQRCTACGICIAVCPENAWEWRPAGRLVIFRPEADCVYCGLCEQECPAGAIALSYEISLGV